MRKLVTSDIHKELSAPPASSLGSSEIDLGCCSLEGASLPFSPSSEFDLVFSSLEGASLPFPPSSSTSSSEEESSTRVGEGHLLGNRDSEEVEGGEGRSRGGGDGGHWSVNRGGGMLWLGNLGKPWLGKGL